MTSELQENRKESFGMKKLSVLDKIIYALRVHSIKKYCDCRGKQIMDVWCGYNADFLCYLKDKYAPNAAVAFDLQLNKPYLATKRVLCVEGDLNDPFPDVSGMQFDCIFATAILEHLANPIGFLQQCYAHLAAWGRLILTTPSIYSQPVLEFLAYKLQVISEEEIRDHKDYYDKKKLLDYFQQGWFAKEAIHHEYFELWMNNLVVATK